jgi:hypothetical protein
MAEGIKRDVKGLKEIVDQFDEAHVLVIGDLMLDKYIQGTVSRLSPAGWRCKCY